VLSRFRCPNVVVACLGWEVLISAKAGFLEAKSERAAMLGLDGRTSVCLWHTGLLCARRGKASQSQRRGAEPFQMHGSRAGTSHLPAAAVSAGIWRLLMRLGQTTANYNYNIFNIQFSLSEVP